MDYGEWFGTLVDAGLNVRPSQYTTLDTIRYSVKNELQLPNRFLYSTESGASHWERLVDSGQCPFRQACDNWWQQNYRDVASQILEWLPPGGIDFVSLGPGLGKKDRLLVRALLEQLPENGSLEYYPYDVSLPLLTLNLNSFRNNTTLSDDKRLRIKALLADFETLKTSLPGLHRRAEPNVFSLLGNTLGNVEKDNDLLQRISECMHPGDLLLLEVRAHGHQSNYEFRENCHHDFTPLEYLGLRFDPSRHSYAQGRAPGIPETIERTGSYQLSDDEQNLLTAQGIEGVKSVRLSRVREYSRKKLFSHVASLGLEVFSSELNQEFQIFLVARKPGRPIFVESR